MIFNDPTQAATPIAQQIAAADRILVLTHINPDGDAIGSLLGTWHVLRLMGKQAIPLASSDLPTYTRWLPGADEIEVYEHGSELPAADLVIVVDTASLARIGTIYDEHEHRLRNLPLVIVDHHVTNEGHGTVNLITSSAASTCELLYQLFDAMDVEITPDVATCLLLGLTTDTQSFQTSSTRAGSLRAAAALLDLGADHTQIINEIYYALPASSASLIGLALSGMRFDHGVVWATVTQAMIRATGAEDESADEVVRVIQRISGVRALVLFKERTDGTTKISLRSHPPYNVAALAQRWGGGGHAQAAGATLMMSPNAAEAEVVPLLRELVKG